MEVVIYVFLHRGEAYKIEEITFRLELMSKFAEVALHARP